MNPPLNRPQYQPSGRIDVGPFYILTMVAAGVAIGCGYLLFLVTGLRFPLFIMLPILFCLPVSGAVAIAVRYGRCRNPVAGGLLGVAAGALFFVSAFQFDLAAAKGENHLHRIDMLPQHIRERVLEEDKPAAKNPKNRNREAFFQWMLFGVGCAGSLFLPVLFGWLLGSKPYCEERRRWFQTWSVLIKAKSGRAIADALFWNRAESLAAIEVTTAGRNEGPAELVFDFLADEPDSPVYLSISLVPQPKGKNSSGEVRIWPERLARRWELTPIEAALFAEMFPIPGAAFKAGWKAPGSHADSAATARVVTLADYEAGGILTTRTRLTAVGIELTPLLSGIGLAILGIRAGVVHWNDWARADAIAAIVGGSLAGLLGLLWVGFFPDFLASLYFRTKARQAVRYRTQADIDPDDPDALFVQVVPRKNWGLLMLETAEEMGFLLVDRTRKLLFYEGDRERWTIPAAAVLSCEVEGFDVGVADPSGMPMFSLVVIKANVEGQVWEAPVSLRPVRLRRNTPSTRKRRADWLRDHIRGRLGLVREQSPNPEQSDQAARD